MILKERAKTQEESATIPEEKEEIPSKVKSKGSPEWKPAERLSTFNKKPGWVYRWCDKDFSNIERKLEEGWVFVNSSTGIPGEHNEEDNPVDGAKSYREMVLMALPEEVAQSRRAYYDKQADAQERAIKRNLEADLASGGDAKVHGKIVIE